MPDPRRTLRRPTSLVPPLLREVVDFRRLWAGQTISVFGDEVNRIGIPLVAVLALGADAAEMGSLAAAGLLPHLLFSLPAGALLDRVRSRRRLMIVADLGRAALMVSIPIAFALGVLSIAQLFIVGFLAGTLAVVFDLSWNTVFVSVVKRERFVEAMSLLNGSRSLAYVGGPTIGGALVQVLGAPLAMLGDALSYLGSVAFLRRIESPEPLVEPEEGRLRDRLLAGLSFIARDPIIRPILLSSATINLFNFAFSALFILYATTTLGVSPGLLGLALGSGAIGGVIGAVIASGIGRRIGLGPAYALGCVVFPVSLILIPVAESGTPFPVILALLFASEFGAGLGVMILDINVGAVMSARMPDRVRSRAVGAFRFVNYGVRPIGAVLGGLLGAALGVREALFVATIASTFGVLWLVGTRILRLRDLPEAAG
ncbi:MAG: MFS transporter [Candidatus Limnocylindrales bacterium]